MTEVRAERRLAAVLAADMVGYSRLMEADETGTIARQRTYRSEIIDPKIAAYGGRIVKTTGDGMLVEFGSVVDATECAVAIQRTMADREAGANEEHRIEYRVGINLGDIVIDGDDILGDGVNIAARLEALSEPGGLCISDLVYQSVVGKLDLTFEDLGEQHVKNISKPVHAYRVVLDRERTATNIAPLLPDKPSIAVLPFDNLSNDPDQEYFADGLAEDIITGLSRFPWFFVIARNTSFTFKGRSIDVKEVARQLGVQYVLEGSVRKSANRVRVTAQLIDALADHHVWAQRYDRELDDIFLVQDEITEAIVGEVTPSFVSAEARRVERKAPDSVDSWDYVIRGNWHLSRGGRENILKARRLFEAALELDPKNAMAHSGLAFSLAWMIIFSWSDNPEETRSLAEEEARRSIDLDDKDAQAHMILGVANFAMLRPEAAVAEYKRALEINPSLAYAHSLLAVAYSWQGADNEAMHHAEMARRLSPRDPGQSFWSFALTRAEFGARNYQQAAQWAKLTTEVMPEFPPGWRHLAASLVHLDRLDEAYAAKDELLRVNSRETLKQVRGAFPGLVDRMDNLIDGLRKAGVPE
jgi:TolB-like protein